MKIKDFGQVFTPSYIVNDVLDAAGYIGENILNKHVIDNSCGDGAFLLEIIDRYINAYKNKNHTLDGVENDLKEYIHKPIKYINSTNYTNIKYIAKYHNITNLTKIKEDEENYINNLLNFTTINKNITFEFDQRMNKTYKCIYTDDHDPMVTFLYAYKFFFLKYYIKLGFFLGRGKT